MLHWFPVRSVTSNYWSLWISGLEGHRSCWTSASTYLCLAAMIILIKLQGGCIPGSMGDIYIYIPVLINMNNSTYLHHFNHQGLEHDWYMEVSWNGGTPKASILIGFSIINYPFWGTPNLGNPHIELAHGNWPTWVAPACFGTCCHIALAVFLPFVAPVHQLWCIGSLDSIP